MKNNWFYTVTWWEGSLFRCSEFSQEYSAFEKYKKVVSSTWQTKAREIKVQRFGANFVSDVTPAVEEA